MKTKIKRHSRSVLSVVLALCMLLSCMTAGMIMTDAAKVDSGTVGGSDNTITDYFFKGSFDGWTKHYVNSSGEASININTAGTYEFVVITGGGTQRRADYTFTSSGSRNTAQDQSNFKIKVTTTGTYTFKTSTMDSGGSVTVTLTFPSGGDSTSTDWRLVDGGCNWTHANSTKKFTLNSATGYYEYSQYFTGNNYFRISDGTSQYNGNGGSSNVRLIAGADFANLGSATTSNSFAFTPSPAGTYIVQIDATNKKIRIQQATQYTVTCQAPTNGTLTSSVANAYEGDTVTLTVTPNAGYAFKSLVLTYDGTDHDVTSQTNGDTYTFTMPAFNVTAAATFTNSKTIYFNNYEAKWSKVYVYTKNANGEEGNGSAPGLEMTRVGTSSIYSAEIPADTNYIVFSGSGGATNAGSTHITYKTNTNYGNSLPSDYTEYKATAADGSTGEWTAHSDRNNVYTVTPGTSITGNNSLYYNGITATMYDYYTDGEYNSGNAKWITGIKTHQSGQRTAEYSVDNGTEFKWNPYKTLNAALSSYAADNSVPYPLYFGNLNIRDSGSSEGYLQYVGGSGSSVYTNWADKISNSVRLMPDGTSVTGLASATESNSTIAHSNSNGNGAAMMMFDEDWLSQENATGNPLATILHSSAFPVRKLTSGGVSDTVWLDENGQWNGSDDHGYIYAWVWGDGKTSKWVKFTNQGGNIYKASGVSGYTNMKVVSLKTENISDGSTTYGSPDIAYGNHAVDNITINVAEKAIYKLSGYNAGSFTTHSSDTVTITGGYTYYEYDSTNGTDNAYIQNVKTGDHTATIEYSTTEKAYSANAGGGSTAGFYPFDNMKASDSSHTNDIDNVHLGTNRPHDLGFGMKLEIPFSLNPNGTVDSTANGIAQTFNFSGDDDLWVYIDGHLVLDLGGAHKKAEGNIDFKNKTATSTTKVAAASAVGPNTNNNDYTATDTYSNNFSSWFDAGSETLHTMTIYYMERGMFESNLKFDFSFHAISNLYTTEKKIRTRNINSGFYVKDNTTLDPVTGMTKFEASYQYEHFNVDHKVSSDDITYANPANVFNYARVEITPTLNGDTKFTHTEEHAANADLVYNLTNDDRAQFNGKFTSGDYFQLTETAATSNKYSYTPTLTVYDDTDKSGKTKYNVTPLGNNSFKFRFDEPNNGLKTVNVRGQLENVMKQHDLKITKSIGDKTDDTTEFEFQIKFKFAYHMSNGTVNNQYEGYPLYLSSDKDATKTQTYSKSQSHGYFKLKAGETITIPKIPEGAEFEIIETLDNITNYTYGGMSAVGATATPVPGENAVTMTMGTSPVAVTATNVSNNLTISKKILDNMTSKETYNINIKTKDDFTVAAEATAYKGPYVIKHANGDADTSVPSDDSRTECKVTINPDDQIKIGVVNETYFEITEEALSSTYQRKFHYVSSTVGTTTFETDTPDTANVKKVTNGVLVKVTSDTKTVDINNKAWGYMIEYTYPGYLKRYGVHSNDNQKYYVSGLFSEDDYKDKVELAEVVDTTSDDTVQGVKFKTDEIQKNFITSHAPYENNFMTDLTWNPIFEGATGANTNRFFYANNTGQEVNMKTNAVVTENKECQVYFRFPFAYTSSNAGLVPTPSQNDGGKVLMTDAKQMNVQAPYGKWYTLNNKYTEAEAKFVSAPREIYKKNSDGTYDKYVFRHWSMKTTPTGHARRTTEEYKRCYYWDFNMTFYQDTIVEPVYALAGNEGTDLTPAELETLDTTNGGGTNITFLENSRNQWNRDGGYNQEVESRKPQGDRVYSDFLLSFSWDDIMLRTALSKKITETQTIDDEEVEVTYYTPYTVGDKELHYSGGLVIEKVADAPAITSTNDIKTQDQYREMYGYGDDLVTAATNYINSGNTNGGNFLLNETFSAAGFDNKNQFEYSTSFANKSHDDLSVDRPYKTYVYRAYTYLRDYDGSTATTDNCMVNGSNASADEVNKIKNHNGELLKVSKPVYFTIYEMATIENGTTYTGQGES